MSICVSTQARLSSLTGSAYATAVTGLFLLSWAAIGAGSLSAQAYVSVQVNNLTHPDLTPNFLAGDTYQYVVSGPPNQPVFNVQNSGTKTQVGQTDGNGTFVTTGVEQPAWIGDYTQLWYVGDTQASAALNFTVSLAAVVARDLTHPNLSPNFLAGDTYQYTVYGPPNQPVYNVQNSGPMTQVGQTDSNGIYVATGVEQTAWVGSYTQIWSVGNNQASPALSFLVGQISGGGTLNATSTAESSDGSVIGQSSVSVTNGVATSFSLTEMNYNTSAYYDAQTVGTLFENGVQVQQAADYRNGAAGGSLSYPASSWNDYSLETDHYAVAYLVSGSYYNPYYFQGGSCDEGNSDCSYWPGGGNLYLTTAAIFLGSTITDQIAVPQDGSVAFSDDVSSVGSILPGRTPPTGGWAMIVNKWKEALGAAWAITLIKQSQDSSVVLPFMLQTIGDCQARNQTVNPPGVAERTRTYRVLDGLGRPWRSSNPLVIRENIINWTAIGDIKPNGNWGTPGAGTDDQIENGIFSDLLSQWKAYQPASGALQQFYAQAFEVKGFSYPSIFGYAKGTVPLLIIDTLSKAHKGIFGTLANIYSQKFVSINNDGGDAPNLIYTNFGSQLKLPANSCGEP